MHLVGRSPDNLLRFLPTELFHSRVVVFLRFCQEHLKHASLVLFFECIEVVDDYTDEQVQGEEGAAHDEDDKVEIVVLAEIVTKFFLS